jgi:hypothetical protein
VCNRWLFYQRLDREAGILTHFFFCRRCGRYEERGTPRATRRRKGAAQRAQLADHQVGLIMLMIFGHRPPDLSELRRHLLLRLAAAGYRKTQDADPWKKN